jgi:caa(3)-type oxidase subunit IV
MSDTAEHHHDSHPPKYYVKIWGFLLILLVISFVGPELGIKWLTLITAFGIALVKAGMVCAYFMHMNIEKKYVWYILTAVIGYVYRASARYHEAYRAKLEKYVPRADSRRMG